MSKTKQRKRAKPQRDTKNEMRELLLHMAMAANDGYWPEDGVNLWAMGVETFGRFCAAVETKFRPNHDQRIN